MAKESTIIKVPTDDNATIEIGKHAGVVSIIKRRKIADVGSFLNRSTAAL